MSKGTSETSKCRPRLAPYCAGNGVDLGCGGDLIVPDAIGVDMPRPYTSVGDRPIQLKGDATMLQWFRDEALDYIFSSHLLEDFVNTQEILTEWLRVLKLGGHLSLFLPVEMVYRDHCKKTGQTYNLAHKVPEMSLDYIRGVYENIGVTEEVHSNALIDEYSFEIVVKKIKPMPASTDYSATYAKRIRELEWTVDQIKKSPTFKMGERVARVARMLGLGTSDGR